MQIQATESARRAVTLVRSSGRTELVMVLSSGCCDSTSPYLYDNFLPEATSEQVGSIDGVPVYAPAWLARLYPGPQSLTIDATALPAEDSFSLETDHGLRFVLRARAAH